MKYDITISPIFSMTCFRSLALVTFPQPKTIDKVTERSIKNYLKSVYKTAAVDLIDVYTSDPNNRLEVQGGNLYEHIIKDDLHETMQVLFSASKNKKTLKSLEKYFSIADILPFEYGLFCFHTLLLNGYSDILTQESIPNQLYGFNNIQALRFLDRVTTVLRINLFTAISTNEVDSSVYKAFKAANPA